MCKQPRLSPIARHHAYPSRAPTRAQIRGPLLTVTQTRPHVRRGTSAAAQRPRRRNRSGRLCATKSRVHIIRAGGVQSAWLSQGGSPATLVMRTTGSKATSSGSCGGMGQVACVGLKAKGGQRACAREAGCDQGWRPESSQELEEAHLEPPPGVYLRAPAVELFRNHEPKSHQLGARL